MNAREEAIEAAYDADSMRNRTVADIANAASNVWEPLLRDLVVAYEHAVEHKGAGHTLDDGVFIWGGYKRAKEALSE